MTTITIKRPHRAINRFRKYKIFIDGTLLGTIANNETKVFTTEIIGKQTLQAKIDWCSSPNFPMELSANGHQQLLVDLHKDTAKSWSYFFYSGFFILILDFILRETLHFPYALLLMVFPFLYMIYLLVYTQKKTLFLTEIINR